MSDTIRDRPEWAYRFAAFVVLTYFERILRWRIDMRGVEHVPRRGGAVITFNHHSYGDFFMCALGPYRHLDRAPRFLAKQELFDTPGLGFLMRQARLVPVARGSRRGRARAFDEAVRRLKAGELVAVAPEQTISRSFELLPFKTGAVRMAREAGVPVVPSVNWGTQRWATKGRTTRWLARRIPVLVRYGVPLTVRPGEELTSATRRVRERMASMLDDVQRSYPDEPASGDDWWLPERLGGSAASHEEVLREHRERERRWRGERDDPGRGAG